MRDNRNFFAALKLIVICALAGFAAGYAIGLVFSKTGTYNVTVCQTTDTHGAYFDSLYAGGLTNGTSFANVASYLASMRDTGLNPVVIDCGDVLQGDNAAYYYNFVNTTDRHIACGIFEYLGYDALVVGNHDIETGHEVYDRLYSELDIPLLAANAVSTRKENEGNPYFKEYTVVKRDGIKIAVVGMTNAYIKFWLSRDKWDGMEFLDISSMAQEVIDRVRKKEKPHLVILAIHSGAGDGSDGYEDEALYLASSLKGIDLVLYGHDHKPLCERIVSADGREVPVLNAGTKNRNVARCDFSVVMKRGKVKSVSAAGQIVPMDGYAPDSAFCASFRPMFEEVKAYANKEIGTISCDLDFDGCLEGPNAYISLIHAVQLESTGADISFTAPLSTKGCVRAGTVTVQDLARIYRYENTLNKISMTGRQIKDYLEYSYDLWLTGSAPSYCFDSAEGLDYQVSRSSEAGNRVDISSLSDGRCFSPDSTYTVAMNSYRSNGGGGHLAEGAGMNPAELVILGSYPDIRSLVGEYVAAHSEVAPAAASNWKFVK